MSNDSSGQTKILCRHGEKHWNGSDPECAFDEEGKFREENWNCFLLNTVRSLMNQHFFVDDVDTDCPYGKCWWDEDSYQGVLYLPCGDNWWNDERDELKGAVVLMTWYKSRGRTDTFQIVSRNTVREGTEKDAVAILEIMKEYHEYDSSSTTTNLEVEE